MRVEIVDAGVTHDLRLRVLRPGFPPDTLLPGDGDPESVHLAAYADDDSREPIGACVLLEKPFAQLPERPLAWQLRGMATDDAHRGEGVGRALVETAVDVVQGRGGRLLWCKAREYAIGFYEATGFRELGEHYVVTEVNLPHVDMWREV